MATPRKTFVIRRAEQLAALSSPVRCRIVESLSVHGPSSVREIASRVDRLPESLYYHVRALVDVGIVLQRGKRKVGRRSEAVYRLVAPRLVIDPKQRSRAYLEALTGTCAAVLRLAERNYRTSVDRGGFTLSGAKRSLLVRRCTARLDRAGLTELNQLLDRVADLLEEHEDSKSSDTYALTIVLTQLADG